MSDLEVDFGKVLFEGLGSIIGLGPVPVTIGKVVIEAIGALDEAEEKKKALTKKIEDSINNKKPVKITEDEAPILRKAVNRTINILSFGKIEDALE